MVEARAGARAERAPDPSRDGEEPRARTRSGDRKDGDPALTAYLACVRRHRVMSREEEHEVAVQFRETGDTRLAQRLVTANLRLVMKLALEYRGMRRHLTDLIQEGNVGLLHAVQKFDPHRGVKLGTYAAWWIRAYMLKFILSNARLVKLGTTQAQRRLFFGLRRTRARLEGTGGGEVETTQIAASLSVSPREVEDMERRMSAAEASLDGPSRDGDRRPYSECLPAENVGPDVQWETEELGRIVRREVEAFGKTLEGRDLVLFKKRILCEDTTTLATIATKFGVSRERARQIEGRLKMRLRAHLREVLGDAVPAENPRGASFDGRGVNFAVYSRVATRVEICLYDPGDPSQELARFDLPDVTGFTFHGYVPDLEPGALYGLRVHGPYAPARGHRCNPSKLLVDPYAKALYGEIDWTQPVFGYRRGDAHAALAMDPRDSAAGVPKSVVVDPSFDWRGDGPPSTPWRKTILYEAHVRGLTRNHPALPEALRGTYAGLAHPAIVEHLQRLGVTALVLLPVHQHGDDGPKPLLNYWGYDTLGFFAPEQRYARERGPGAAVREFKEMVSGLHAAGIEILLDVVYSHTCEGGHLGPTLSFRGIDNATYYWLMPEPCHYLDFTGMGNSLNASNPETARLIADSLRYWATEMHVDGFRLEFGSTLGRGARGQFDPGAPLFQIIGQDPVLSRVKLIAEPRDVGLGGEQLGNFPAPFGEWNVKFRDAVRRYWKGDENLALEVGYRLSGSADLFHGEKRQPQSSINFVTSHDGFTLHDLVTYGVKHNEANGEGNQDGSDDNQSWNHGVEGETDDPAIVELRDRQQRNLLATLFLSQGVPMLLAGDELGRTQRGNNNAYCHDDDLAWVAWRLDDRGRRLLEFTRRLVELRRRHPVLQRPRFLVGDYIWESASRDIAWLRPDGEAMSPEDWRRPSISSLGFVMGGDALQLVDERGERLLDDNLLVLMNVHDEPTTFRLPANGDGGVWFVELDTAAPERAAGDSCAGDYKMVGRSVVVLRQPLQARAARQATRPPPQRAARRRRRAGVVMPLFSIRSSSGWGLGEVPDLGRFAAWAGQAGFSVVQVLPVNETSGADASPYGAASAFAIDPAYLSLDACEDFVAAGGRAALAPELRELLARIAASPRVEWSSVRRLKQAGVTLAFERFLRDEWAQDTRRARELAQFMKVHTGWLEDHALFRAWHDRLGTAWWDWPPAARDRDPGALAALRLEAGDAILRVKWAAWQLDLQWRGARRAAAAAGVDLMGDLPFVVGLDAADVWAHRGLFRTDLHVGTPPEPGAPDGQDWGLPVYDWAAQARDRFAWIRERSMRSGALFSLYRIDHVMGFYRTFFRSADGRESGFTPADEHEQLALGETLMRLMGQWAEVVAEDLGAVPGYLRPSLERLDIPGYRVLRWEKDGDRYRDPASWPEASVATNATHDTDTTAAWFDGLPLEERERLRAVPGLRELATTGAFDERAREQFLRVVYDAPSTLALVMFQDALGTRERINVPGTCDDGNWTYRAAQSLEELFADRATTERLARLASATGRAARAPWRRAGNE